MAPPAPRVRDIGRPATAVPVEWDVRTAYDFLFSLSDDAGASDDLPAEDRAWLGRTRDRLRGDVGDAYELFGKEVCISLAGLAVDHPTAVDAAAFLALVESTPTATVIRTVLGAEMRDPRNRDLLDRSLAGDGEATSELLAPLVEHHGGDTSKVARLLRDPIGLIEAARAVLRAWLPAFEEIEPRVASMLQRDVELRAADKAHLTPEELIERTTGGIRWLSEPGVRRVILAPSYFSRPYNFVLGGPDWRMFGYPISDAALDARDPLAPPPAVVRLHRALGDETRLRILRLLRDQDAYLTEIAERLELSKPTIKHHLALLRAAGLVTVVEEGGYSYFNLRRERLDDASTELKRFLVG